MKRTQRKANLKKLFQQNNTNQNSVNGNPTEERRITRRSKQTTTETSASVYFNKDKKTSNQCNQLQSIGEQNEEKNSKKVETDKCIDPSVVQKKRLNLTRFLFKDTNDIPQSVRKMETDSDDFETPVKKMKKAPKLSQPIPKAEKMSKTRKKPTTRQLKIKNAFLRNEQKFSEIAAQHSIAENFDPDEVQLALAISRSDVELCAISAEIFSKHDGNDVLDCAHTEGSEIVSNDENIRKKLRKFGFRTGAKEDYTDCFAAAFLTGQRKRAKTKWANKYTALTLRGAEVQAKKLTSNVNALMVAQNKRNPLTIKGTENKLIPYEVHSSQLRKCAVLKPKVQSLRKAEYMNPEEQLEKYFVEDLFPISKLPAGHLLKKWEIIPGRDISPERITEAMKLPEQKYQTFYTELENLVFSHQGRNDNDIVAGYTECQQSANLKNIATLQEENIEIDNAILSVQLHKLEDSLKSLAECNELNINKYQCIDKNHSAQANKSTDQEVKTDASLTLKKIDAKNVQCVIENLFTQSTKTIDQNIITDSGDSMKLLEKCTQLRPISPDLFDDSDSEGEICETNHLNDITIYETYSTDDEKNPTKVDGEVEDVPNDVLCSDVDGVIDLTQDDEHAVRDNKQVEALAQCVTTVLSNDNNTLLDIESCNKSFREIGDTLKIEMNNSQQPICIEEYTDCRNHKKSNQSSNFQTNKDLDQDILSPTQRIIDIADEKNISTNSQLVNNYYDDDYHSSDECIVLSDDEINYSILRAKAATPSVRNKSHISCTDLSENSLSIEEQSPRDSNDIPTNDYENNFSVLEFIDEHEPFDNNKKSNKSISFDLSTDREPINSAYLAVTPLKGEFVRNSVKRQHAEFGVLDSPFDCFTKTPIDWKQTKSRTTSTSQVVRYLSTPLTRESARKSIKEKHVEFGNLDSLTDSFLEALSDWKDTPKSRHTGNSIKLTKESPNCILSKNASFDLSSHRAFINSESLITSSRVVNSLSKISKRQSTGKSLKEKQADFGTSEKVSPSFLEGGYDWKDTSQTTPKRRKPLRNSIKPTVENPKDILCLHPSFDLSSHRTSINPKTLSVTSNVINCLSTPSKKQKDRKSIKELRAEFGILESQSESFSQNQLEWNETPKLELSPLNTSKNVVGRRRCRSSQKFQSFLIDQPIVSKSSESEAHFLFDDFDEFDRLVYGSPAKEIQSDNIPSGLSQLLTAEISFIANDKKSKEETLQKQSKQQQSFDEEITINDHVYSVRVTRSPKPKFALMSDDELLKQLCNYGIKPLMREQSIKLLDYIYNETHPILGPQRKSLCALSMQQSNSSSLLPQALSTSKRKTNEPLPTSTCNSQPCESTSAFKNATKSLHFHDCFGDVLLRFSMELFPEFQNGEEPYIFQTNITKKTLQPLLPLHVAWYNLVCSSTELHENMLMYEAIDLQEIYLFLKGIGYRYDPKELKNFFDRRCIIFRYDLKPPVKQMDRIRQRR